VKTPTVRVNVSLTQTQYDLLKKKAYGQEMQPGTLAKKLILEGMAKS